MGRFKKFSEFTKEKVNNDELDSSALPEEPLDDSDIPMNPNLSKKSKKVERMPSRKNLIPKDQNVDLPSDDDEKVDENSEVKTYGKVAKFPKNIKASNAYNFLENVKVSKKSIWYIMVEKQDNELQMVKYNYNEGVNLNKFVSDLKTYYKGVYKDNEKVREMIESIYVDGNDKFSMVKNIPLVEVDGKKMITKITEDLIRLLS
jgi:hypothetical protein